MDERLDVLRLLLPAHIDAEQVEERLSRIRQHIHCITESRLAELLVVSGFDRPVRVFHSSIYGCWVARKK